MTNKVSIVSMNAQGIGDRGKRRDVVNFLKTHKYSVCMLQDTHFITKEEKYIRAIWGYDTYFSNFSSQSRGVAIFINNNFDCKVNSIEKDDEGNLLILNCKIYEKNITLVNIYGPNRDNPNFFEKVSEKMSNFEDSLFILAGDFNLVLDPDTDCHNYLHLNNPKARDKLFNIMSEYNLMDCWRENNIEKREYTWFRQNPIKKARLDFFLISNNLYTDVDSTSILPGYRTDHSLIYMSLEFGKFKKGLSYWKFNNSLLRDEIYVNKVKRSIYDTKLQYMSDIPENTEIINDIQPQELQLNINDQLFFETLLINIRGITISHASHKKKMEVNKEANIWKEIENIEKEVNINYELLDNKKQELSELRKKKMNGVFIRSKAKWIHEGEKPTRYFCNLENRNYVSKIMNSLISHEGEHLKTQDEILAETKCHYENLYKSRETKNISLDDTLGGFEIPKLSQTDQQSIEGALTHNEMLYSLKRMSNNTSPGNDGFTVEFFKFFWQDIGYLLVRAINYAYATGELSVTQKQGVITCIPKGNKDKLYLKNWRPISLLNVTYKIASASIACRLKNVFSKIINEDQTGFLPGRLMASNVRMLYDILFYSEKNNNPGLLLLIDFAAAFDTVSWNFMHQALQFFNLGPSIRTWIKLFYNNTESCVIVNGHMSEWFTLQRGCRQGDALSPYLFILCAEILSILIRNNDNIKGITIHGNEYKLSQYADDTSLFLDGTTKSLKNTMLTLKFYAGFSGLNINAEKTKVIWFGSQRNSNTILCPEYNLAWNDEIFTVLGVKFSTDLSEIIDLNYDSKIEEIKRLFANWSKRVITPIGKIVVIKSLALAKLNHLILGIPNPSLAKINTIQNLFFKFLWSNSRDKVKRNIITQDYKYGGLKMIDLKCFINSLKVTWLRRLINSNNKFSNFIDITCPFISHIFKFGSDYIRSKLRQDINPFWKDVLYSYYSLSINLKPTNSKQCYSVHIWKNPGIKVGNSSIYLHRWISAGILFLGDLLNQDGEFFSYNEFTANYNIISNFLEYRGIVNALSEFLEVNNIQHLPQKINYHMPIPQSLLLIKKDNKGCRSIYKAMQDESQYPNSLQKWQDKLRFITNPSFFQNNTIYDMVYKYTKDPKLIWFQFRINHRIIATNYLLKKMNIINDDSCTFCQNEPETLVHLFYDCEIIKQFWQHLQTYVKQKCNINFQEFGETDILFGITKLDLVLNKLILFAKHHIYYCRIKKLRPNLENFKNQIVANYKIEKYAAKQTSKYNEFEKTWDKFKNLVNSDI